MSIKSQVFTASLGGFGPANTYDYVVVIPKFGEFSILASAVTCPTIKRGQVTVPFWGQIVNLPAPVEESTGELLITVPERMDMGVRWELYKMFLNQEHIDDHEYFDIYVSSIQGAVPAPPIIYKDCWFKSKSDVIFNSSAVTQPMLYTLTFVYNGIDESIKTPFNPAVLMAEQIASLELQKGLGPLNP